MMMSRSSRVALTFAAGLAAVAVMLGAGLKAQVPSNPYRTTFNWDKVQGRKIGTPSGIKLDPDGEHLWILDRCGANGCAGSNLDPIIQITLDGKIVKSWGKGLFAFPHGFFVDSEGNVWITEGGAVGDARGEPGFKIGIGHQVRKFTRDGKLLMSLGEAAVAGADEKHFNGPTGVVVAANGDIWVTDGHGGGQKGPNANNMFGSRGGNNRLVRFSKDGKFLKAWGGGVGSESYDPLRFNDPHDIAIDAEGRLYIADRGNARLQILDKEGNFITQWTQFGKPSAVLVAGNTIYVADGMSDAHWNPGWERGIRIGDIKTGWVKAFIPDVELIRGAGTEFIGVDNKGTIYAGASGRPGLVMHQLFRPLF